MGWDINGDVSDLVGFVSKFVHQYYFLNWLKHNSVLINQAKDSKRQIVSNDKIFDSAMPFDITLS